MSYGITQDPSTENYMMVLEYARNGTLGHYMFTNKLSLESKLYYLYNIADGLNTIHKNELIHRDLHAGNILMFGSTACISDLGLCKNYNELENVENTKYGVLSYVAPEIFRGDFYTKDSDIYSFGIIMYLVISETPPYYNMPYDVILVLNICEGLRPEFHIKIPQLILHLIKRCLDANPSIRPTANEVYEILIQWSLEFDNQIELQKQIEEIKMINNKPLTNKIHPEDFYKSRSLNFKNLPEPKNSDDYYELYDNISSKIYSEIKSDKTDYLECEIID
ncbi:uncharacterized protein OCT59_003673 [Rhizophagus irregularis]|uniref:uncharacterized protein n=1 Tax=Rhizophagus irregularis TaxID=588596 RepID=UPI0033247743|nr:hypothetical protein OCT59_003673 [Rhizophagus irregularis]